MRTRLLWGVAASALTLATIGCEEQQFQPGFESDQFSPSISIQKTAGDTLTLAGGIRFGITASDNLGIKNINILLSGGHSAQIDTTFTTAVTSVSFDVTISLPANSTSGGNIVIQATVTDGSDLTATTQDSVFLVNDDALVVRLLKPNVGAVASPGLQIPIEVLAIQRDGITQVGYVVTGVVTDSVSILRGSPLPDTVDFLDTLAVPSGTSNGTFDIVGFATDSSGRTALATPLTVTVQSIGNDNQAPLVDFQIARRVEVSDSITVQATDPSGVNQIAYTATLLDGTPVKSGTMSFSGLTDVSQTFPLDLVFASLPQTLLVGATATDAAGNTGAATIGGTVGGPTRIDTVIVVNGVTKPLPAGGRIVDGIYNRNLNEIYLTNVDLDRLEIFQVADTSFVTGGIPVGSRPWGIALWPGNANGTAGDTVVIANSGGTDLSIVDLRLRREVRRHSLPNFLIDQVTTELDLQTSIIQIKFTRNDFSDRPQFLAMTCRPGVGACAADQILAVYSTTPTIGQGGLSLRGSVRWENLTSATPSGHFFWEHAEVLPSPDFDTLRVISDRGPSAIPDTLLAAACGRLVDMDRLVFRDTTFIRNSGDFTHALIGEGGLVGGETLAQAVGYNSQAGLTTGVCTGSIVLPTTTISLSGSFEEDNGITPSFRVRDFISNTATAITSIAVNFNGLTNMVRTTDSVFVLNESLRLKGLISQSGINPGMDLNFDHAFEAGVGGTAGTFGGTLDPNDRFVFLASEAPQIDVFDTHFFGKVTTIPIRDPIIGPLRVAKLPTNEQILVGVTSRGVVTVRLPSIVNTFPVSGFGGSRR